MSRTLFFLAGEASGDLHGGKLVAALKALDPSVRCVGMGGPQMAAAGLDVFKDLDGMQVVGFWEVAKRYGFFKQVFYQLLDRVKQEKPDALICIDYPGFNLRFAKEVKRLGIPCLYYIVPQVWAWKPKRAAKMAEFIDRAYCVFEFEPPFFDKFKSPQRAMKTEFVGHPILDCGFRIADLGIKLPPGSKSVSFLPGSREAEFWALYPPMWTGCHLAREGYGAFRQLWSFHDEPWPVDMTEDNFEPAGSIFYDNITNAYWNILTSEEQPEWRSFLGRRLSAEESPFDIRNHPGLSHSAILPALADFSVVKSGTSTLEAGLQGNPMCVVYKGGWISYSIARMLVDIPVFSLVNIVLGKYAVPELLQSEVNPQRIAAEIERGLTDRKYIEQQRAALAELPKKLGGPGASKRTAERMLAFLDGRD